MAWSKQFISQSIRIPIYLSVILIGIHVINVMTGMSLGVFGIYPRELNGLPGIFTAPLIHGDFQHLFSNLVPLFTMMVVMLLFYPRVAVKSLIFIYIFTGVSVWLLGRSVFHIGASGVVYGVIAFVFWLGIFRRSAKSIVLALVMIIMYSGYFAGILPNQPGISWESHLLGALVGIAAAFLFKGQVEEDEKPKVYDWELEESSESQFLPEDIFSETKEERRRNSYYDYWNQDDTHQ